MPWLRARNSLARDLAMRIPDGPIFVDPLPSQVTGVDFLGLAAVNERLVALSFPGISNVTRYLRAYSAMSWMTWRFAEYLKQEAERKSMSERDIGRRFRRFREKVELLFTLGNPDHNQVAGQTRRDHLPERGRFPLEFSAFGNFKISWLDAAVYGPSLGSENGLGFLERAPGASYRPTLLGEELARGLDAVLQKSPYYNALIDVEANTGSNELVSDLGERWAVRESSAREREVYRKGLFPENAGVEGGSLRANRVAMIRLVLRAVKLHGGRATIDEVRQAIARGLTASGKGLELADCAKTQGMWSVLQLRQLQRLAHESLLRWLEGTLLNPPSTLKGRTPAALAELAAQQTAAYFDAETSDPLQLVLDRLKTPKSTPDFYIAGLSRPRLDPFRALDDLQGLADVENHTPQLPGMALYCLALCAKQAEFLTTSENRAPWLGIGGRSRLSLRSLTELFSVYRSESLSEFMRFLIESCVVGQHFAITGAKLEADKNKYRFISTDEGLRLLIRPNQITRLNVTGDRLQNAMELMADCALLSTTETSGTFALP